MSLFRDWKFLLATLVGVAGVVASAGWLSGNPEKSLTVKVVHQESLGVSGGSAIPELVISIGGNPLLKPYISLIQLVNDGDKPISTADFEAPLEIRNQKEANIVNAKIVSKNPEEISGDILWKNNSIIIAPRLFNKGDFINISIVSSGERPVFYTFSRIIGVKTVKISTENDEFSVKKVIFLIVSAGFVMIPAFYVVLCIFQLDKLHVNNFFGIKKYELYWIFYALILTGGILLSNLSDKLWGDGVFSLVLTTLGFFICTIPIAFLVRSVATACLSILPGKTISDKISSKP